MTITGNHVDQQYRPETYGLRIQTGSRACVIVGNQFLHASRFGAEVLGASMTVIANHASGRSGNLNLPPTP